MAFDTAVSSRGEALRDAARRRPPMLAENPYYWPAALLGEPGRLPARRFADAFCATLRVAQPVVHPQELIVGALTLPEPDEAQRQAVAEANRAGYTLPPRTIDGHMGLDHDRLLRLGLTGVRDLGEQRRAELDPTHGEDTAACEYLRACRDCLDAALEFCDRLAETVEADAAAESDPARRAELATIAATCRRVPRFPAQTFREALQSVWMSQLLSRIENGLCAGRFDRTFWPFYQADLAAGRLTEDEARELIGAFLVKYNEFGWFPQGALLGGLDAAGQDTTNDLSYMFLETQGELALLNPATCISWNRHTPARLMEEAVDYVCRGNSLPSFMNDEVIVAGLVEAGVDRAEAVNYLNSTCVEISVQGCSGIRVVADYISFPQILLRTLHNGRDVTEAATDSFPTGAADQFAGFADLLAALQQQLVWALDENARRINRGLLGHPTAHSYPFSSCFVRDCLERGRDWSDGGPRYNFAYPQLVGMANVVDSLMAIRELVYERRELTLPEFAAIVDSDFADQEPLRRRVVNTLPKWGTSDEQADALAGQLVDWYYERTRHHRSHLDMGQYHPGFLCWVMHASLGKLAPATPDGRRAGTAFADSLAAAQGRASAGPTGEIASLAKLDFQPALGGMVYNLLLNRTMYDTREGRGKLRDLLETYLQAGGFQAQISVVNGEMLREAQENREKYADLMVKVGGYSDYFVDLSPELQEALIAKSE
ncbi:MAG TPA: pyruvate formate lyase family protein [Armatimonadota bacterium]